MADIFRGICPYCKTEADFADNEKDAKEAQVPCIPPMHLGNVAGTPSQELWVMACDCGMYYIYRKTMWNTKQVSRSIQAQRMRPSTKIVDPVYFWDSCTVEQFMDELSEEHFPGTIRRVKRILAEEGYDLPLPENWSAVSAKVTSRPDESDSL